MINRVLLYNSGGGVGDAIQILPLIDTLKTEFKNVKFLKSIKKSPRNVDLSTEFPPRIQY